MNNQKGFIQIPIIIVFIALGVIATAMGGYYANNQIKKAKTEQPTVIKIEDEVTITTEEISKKETRNTTPPSFQDKIKPVNSLKKGLTYDEIIALQEEEKNNENLKKEKTRLEMISFLSEDIDTLKSVLDEIVRSRERYISYAEEVTRQREQSLTSLLPLAPDIELKNFIQKGVSSQQQRLVDIREDYETSFGFIEDALREYVEKITFVRDELTNEMEADDLLEYLLGADSEIDRFLSLLKEVNSMASNREKLYSEAYTKYLGYIDNLNSVYQIGYSVSYKLSDIESSMLEEPKSLEINCWSTTESIGGLFSGKSQTTIRCE